MAHHTIVPVAKTSVVDVKVGTGGEGVEDAATATGVVVRADELAFVSVSAIGDPLVAQLTSMVNPPKTRLLAANATRAFITRLPFRTHIKGEVHSVPQSPAPV